MKFVLLRSRLPRHRAHWPAAARRRRPGPGRRTVTATLRAIAGRLLILFIKAFVASGATVLGIDTIVLRRTPARLGSVSARGITRDPVRATGARPDQMEPFD
jgi:hypothetical protein